MTHLINQQADDGVEAGWQRGLAGHVGAGGDRQEGAPPWRVRQQVARLQRLGIGSLAQGRGSLGGRGGHLLRHLE